jgi:hypothetical protein
MNDHMICRCEDGTASDVRAAIDAGACNGQAVTGAGAAIGAIAAAVLTVGAGVLGVCSS